MSHLLARIMLALLMLPLGAVVYGCTTAAIFELIGFRNETTVFLIADLVTAVFIALYWFGLWRRSIVWSPARIVLTLGTFGGALGLGIVAGVIGSLMDNGFGVFIGGVVSILVWLLLTVLVWRETGAERTARVRARSSVAIVCPACGYNMTGLNLATCPECGATFSIDELVAGQPAHEQAEIDPSAHS